MRKPKDWGQPCPNPECTHYRRMQQGNVSAIATYLTQSGKRRVFRCHTCETHFAETRETVFFDLRTAEDKVMMALKMLLVRVDLAGISFVLGVTEGSCTCSLRIIAPPRKPGRMSPYHPMVRGHCHDSRPLLLSAR